MQQRDLIFRVLFFPIFVVCHIQLLKTMCACAYACPLLWFEQIFFFSFCCCAACRECFCLYISADVGVSPFVNDRLHVKVDCSVPDLGVRFVQLFLTRTAMWFANIFFWLLVVTFGGKCTWLGAVNFKTANLTLLHGNSFYIIKLLLSSSLGAHAFLLT